jgi:hypothetical protein
MHANTLHARVDLQVDVRRAPERRCTALDGAQLVERGRRQGQIVFEKEWDLFAHDATKHQHRRAHANGAKPQPFL